MSDDNISRGIIEVINKIDNGFKDNQENFTNLRGDLERIDAQVRQLNVDIVELKVNVTAVKNEATEARADVNKLENKVAELEAKAKELELAVEVAKSATPRHLPERVAVIENSLNSVKRFGWFMVTAFAGLAAKAFWDILRMAG